MGARVCVGEIGAPHGVRGLVVVRAFTEVAEDITRYGPVTTGAGRVLKIAVRNAKKAGLIVAVEGVATREAAEALKGERLYVDRDQLPAPEDDEFYHADLVGLAAEDGAAHPLGRVISVHNFGAGDLVEIDPGDGKTVMVPFTREMIPVVDVAGGRLVVTAPDSYFGETGDAAP